MHIQCCIYYDFVATCHGMSHSIQVKLCYLHYSIHTQSLLLLLLDIIQHPLRILSIHDNLRKQNHIQRNTNAITSQNMEIPPHLLNRSHRSNQRSSQIHPRCCQ